MPSAIQVDVDDVPKHERVAHALEQINGLRYRYRGAAKPQKKNINDDSDEGEGTDADEDEDVERAEAKSRRADHQPLTLDDHIERMLLRTRTIALLKIANNTAEVLPDDDEDEDEEGDAYGYGDGGYCEAYDENDEEQFSGRMDDGDADEDSDRFDSVMGVASPPESHSSSMRRIDSMRRPMSFRTTSFRSNVSSKCGGDPEEMAALRLVRKLSTFLSLPKVISYKDLEEITESLLDEPHDESEEYAHLIDEHIDSARDSSSGGGSVTGDSGHHSPSPTTLAHRRMASKKSLRDLNIVEDPEDLDLQQRRLYVENAGLVRYSSKRLITTSSHNLLRGSSQLSMNSVGSSLGGNVGGFGSMRQLGASPSASSHNLMGHKDSKRSMNRGESWRSSGGGGTGSITEENDEKYNEDCEDEGANDDGGGGGVSLGGGVLGTTFDEEGYKQWRTEIKDDYLAWLHAKVEAKKQRRAQRQKEAGQKPRWLLLYEAASKGTRHGSEVETMAADRKQSITAPPRGAGRKSVV